MQQTKQIVSVSNEIKDRTYLVEEIVVAGIQVLEDFLADVELAGGAVGHHIDLAARGHLTEGADASELARPVSLLQVSLRAEAAVIELARSTAVAVATLAHDFH